MSSLFFVSEDLKKELAGVFTISTGRLDSTIPIAYMRRLVKQLENAKAKVNYYEYEEVGH